MPRASRTRRRSRPRMAAGGNRHSRAGASRRHSNRDKPGAMKLRIATRKSALALVQSRWVAERLRALEPTLEIDLLELITVGDRVRDVPLADMGGKGLFVSELEQAVLERRADLAVHSLKDVPAELA